MGKEIPLLGRKGGFALAVSIGLLVVPIPFLLQRHRAAQVATAQRQRYMENYRIVAATAGRFDLPVDLLLAVADVESAFDEKAVSDKGAIGLMQLMPETARETAAGIGLTVWAIEDPVDNALIGAAYLAAMLRRYRDDLHLALAAYNAGPSNVDKWSQAAAGLPGPETIQHFAFEETKKYVTDIIDRMDTHME
jgi:soluble lytic murein transglycosylase-like protein